MPHSPTKLAQTPIQASMGTDCSDGLVCCRVKTGLPTSQTAYQTKRTDGGSPGVSRITPNRSSYPISTSILDLEEMEATFTATGAKSRISLRGSFRA